MFTTTWIESSIAIRTTIIWVYVLINCQFSFANATKDRFFIPFILIPNLSFVICSFLVTLITGIVSVTTPEFYCDHIDRRMVVLATGLIINRFAIYFYLIHYAKVQNDCRRKKFLWINCNNFVTNPSNGQWTIIPGKIPQTKTLWRECWMAIIVLSVLL